MYNYISVETDRLDDTANKVDQFSNDYQRLYQSLYGEVDKLSTNWGGKDNLNFTNQIKSYEDDFKQIHICLNQYSEFLRATARAYRETQEELANAASRLRV